MKKRKKHRPGERAPRSSLQGTTSSSRGTNAPHPRSLPGPRRTRRERRVLRSDLQDHRARDSKYLRPLSIHTHIRVGGFEKYWGGGVASGVATKRSVAGGASQPFPSRRGRIHRLYLGAPIRQMARGSDDNQLRGNAGKMPFCFCFPRLPCPCRSMRGRQAGPPSWSEWSGVSQQQQPFFSLCLSICDRGLGISFTAATTPRWFAPCQLRAWTCAPFSPLIKQR